MEPLKTNLHFLVWAVCTFKFWEGRIEGTPLSCLNLFGRKPIPSHLIVFDVMSYCPSTVLVYRILYDWRYSKWNFDIDGNLVWFFVFKYNLSRIIPVSATSPNTIFLGGWVCWGNIPGRRTRVGINLDVFFPTKKASWKFDPSGSSYGFSWFRTKRRSFQQLGIFHHSEIYSVIFDTNSCPILFSWN